MTESKPAPETQAVPFSAMQLQVGARLQLIPAHPLPRPLFTSIIGYVEHEYLIARLPLDRALSASLTVGERVDVRLFSRTSLFFLKCHVERVLFAPLNQVYLTFPETVQQNRVRQSARVKVKFPATVPGQPETPPSFVTDLSHEGLALWTPAEIGPPGTQVSVQFRVTDVPEIDEFDVSATGEVKGMRAADDGFVTGLQLHFEEGVALAIMNVVLLLQLAGRDRSL